MIPAKKFFNEKDFVKLATAGRHKNVHVIYVKHNLFQQIKQPRTIDLNTTHLILFKSPRDIQQIDYLGRQLNNAKFLRHAYQLATKEDFGHLLIDLDPKTSECLRYSSNIVPPSPTIFYLPSSKAVITSLENERERIMYIEANACRSILTGADSNFIRFLCDCFVNVFLGHVPANKNFIESKKIPFGKIGDPKFSIREKREVLVNNISLVKSIGESCYIYLKN